MDAYLRAVYCSPSIAIVPDFPEEYVVNSVTRAVLTETTFDVNSIALDGLQGRPRKRVKTFFSKLRPLALTRQQMLGTNEADTDDLMVDMLHIVGLNDWPLKVK